MAGLRQPQWNYQGKIKQHSNNGSHLGHKKWGHQINASETSGAQTGCRGDNKGPNKMSNYLRGLGQGVGFTDNTASRGPHGGQGDSKWDMVSHTSSQEGVNLLNPARGLGKGNPSGGGGGTERLGTILSTGHADWDKGNPGEWGTGQLGTPLMMQLISTGPPTTGGGKGGHTRGN